MALKCRDPAKATDWAGRAELPCSWAKGSTMRDSILIENIEAKRHQEGIEDIELVQEIRGLKVGDLVKLTFLSESMPSAAETLCVRITRIEGAVFRGVLAKRPTSKCMSEVRAGSRLTFTAAHIHSIPKGVPAHER